jgi:hypothetical protein
VPFWARPADTRLAAGSIHAGATSENGTIGAQATTGTSSQGHGPQRAGDGVSPAADPDEDPPRAAARTGGCPPGSPPSRRGRVRP